MIDKKSLEIADINKNRRFGEKRIFRDSDELDTSNWDAIFCEEEHAEKNSEKQIQKNALKQITDKMPTFKEI